MKRDSEEDKEDWEFGDAWKTAPEDAVPADEEVEYVEVLRGDTGRGFDDSFMLDLVSFLGSRGIRATYDAFSLGMEPAAIKTYVLRVEAGSEEPALKYLAEKFKNQHS